MRQKRTLAIMALVVLIAFLGGVAAPLWVRGPSAEAQITYGNDTEFIGQRGSLFLYRYRSEQYKETCWIAHTAASTTLGIWCSTPEQTIVIPAPVIQQSIVQPDGWAWFDKPR